MKTVEEKISNTAAKVVDSVNQVVQTPPTPPKKGDYLIQVHIVEVRELKGRDFGDTSDPVVQVKVFDKKQCTTIKKKCLSCVFDEVLYFDFKDLEPLQIDQGKCVVSVFDANAVRKDVMIGYFYSFPTDILGVYEFDLSYIYYSSDHEVYRQWVALSDITDEFEGIQGYLRLSIAVLGPDDEQKSHTIEEEADEDGSTMMKVLMPPHIFQTGKNLKISAYRAEHLPEMDEVLVGSKCDPYVKVDFAGVTVKNEHLKGQDVEFNSLLNIPVMEPVMSRSIIVSLYDYDMTSSDDRISTFTLSYPQIVQFGLQPTWFNLYGAPTGYQKKVASKMNRGYIKGSFYRGRFLISAEVEDCEEPVASVQSCDRCPSNLIPTETFYAIQMDLYEGVEIPNRGKMRVELAIGHYCFESEKIVPTDNSISWYYIMHDTDNLDKMVVTLPKDITQCPDVIIYLSDGKYRFWRFNIERMECKAPMEDKTLDVLDSNQYAGSLFIGLRAGLLTECPSKVSSISRPLSAENITTENDMFSTSNLKIGNLFLTIQKAINIPALDSFSRSSDPYVKIFVDDEIKFETNKIKNCLNPNWNKSFVLTNHLLQTPILLKIFDWNVITDEKIGDVKIDLTQFPEAKGDVDFEVEKVFSISPLFPEAKIFFAFLAFDSSTPLFQKRVQNLNKAVKKKPDTILGQAMHNPFFLHCHIYQARELLSADDSGQADPYCRVSYGPIHQCTRVIEHTLHPCWYQTLSFGVQIAEPIYFSPDLLVEVWDHDKFTRNDKMGFCRIKITEIFMKSQQINLLPSWYKIFDNLQQPAGEILCCFRIYSPDNVPSIPNIVPPSTQKYLEISSLGLRNLSSKLRIFKPYVEFALSSGKRFKTPCSNTPSSLSPNYCNILTIPIEMPIDPLFSPFLDLEIHDNIFGGWLTPLLGSTSINLQGFFAPEEIILKEEEEKKQCCGNEIKFDNINASEPEKDFEIKKTDINPSPPDTRISSSSRPRAISNNSISDNDQKPLLENIDHVQGQDNIIEISKIEKKEEKTKNKTGEEEIKVTSAKLDPHCVLMDINASNIEKESQPPYLQGRPVYDNELEDVISIHPFENIACYTGKRNASIFGIKYRQMGVYKGLINIHQEKPKNQTFRKQFQPHQVFCRVYILQGQHLAPQDIDGSSDPYLIVKCNDQIVSTRSRFINKDLNPNFFESFEFPVTLPGNSYIDIEVWDYDIIGDDLIGRTKVDIEDRWFDEHWRSLPKKPLENRTLHVDNSNISQGKLSLWVDLLTPDEAKRNPIIDIKPPSPLPFELRVIVWGVTDVVVKDQITDQNDLYVTCTVEGAGPLPPQSTDTHLRAKDGIGNFNWRMKFPLELPLKTEPRLRFSIWDLDFLAANDSICECYLSLKGLFKYARKVNKRIKLTQSTTGVEKALEGATTEKITFNNLKHPNFGENQGNLNVSIEMVPGYMIPQLPAGYGRGDPNINPYLPEPEGRMIWSFNPFLMLRQILGNRLYALLAFITPSLISNIISRGLLG